MKQFHLQQQLKEQEIPKFENSKGSGIKQATRHALKND